jgi:hypothetical protein
MGEYENENKLILGPSVNEFAASVFYTLAE